MADQEEPHQLAPCEQVRVHRFHAAQPPQRRQHAVGRQIEQDQIGEQHEGDDDGGDPGIERRKRSGAAALRDQHEDRHQRDQDQREMGREQQQGEIDRQHVPIDAAHFAHRAPQMQDGEGPERHRQDFRPEIRGRDREEGNADHQQGRERGMALADGRAAKLEHRPIGRDHADLREHIDAGQVVAGEAEGDLREPEGQRRPKLAAEAEFLPDHQHVGDIAGRRRIEQGRYQQSRAKPAPARQTRRPAADASAGFRPTGRRTASLPLQAGTTGQERYAAGS